MWNHTKAPSFGSSSRQIAYDLYKKIINIRPQWVEVRECDEGVTLSEKERKEIKPIEKIKMVMTRGKVDLDIDMNQLWDRECRS